jgi:hypothetical protein
MNSVREGEIVETKRVVKRHKARADDPRYRICKGDIYEAITVYGYKVGGDRFTRFFKQVVERAPGGKLTPQEEYAKWLAANYA